MSYSHDNLGNVATGNLRLRPGLVTDKTSFFNVALIKKIPFAFPHNRSSAQAIKLKFSNLKRRSKIFETAGVKNVYS